MKKFIQTIKGFFAKPISVIGHVKNEPQHKHEWKYQYSTSDPIDGKSQVSKCNCGKWAVRHYGQAEMIILADV
jgi:hypothetical protein